MERPKGTDKAERKWVCLSQIEGTPDGLHLKASGEGAAQIHNRVLP